jgi:hypothetical protein
LSKAQTFSPHPLKKHLNTKSSNFSKAENSPAQIEATQYKKLKFYPKLKTPNSSPPRPLKKHLNTQKLKTPPHTQ